MKALPLMSGLQLAISERKRASESANRGSHCSSVSLGARLATTGNNKAGAGAAMGHSTT